MPDHPPGLDLAPGTVAAATGQVALVLGGTGRLGSAVVRGLAGRGFSLAIHGHRGLAAARAAAESLTAAGLPSLAVTANLRDEGATRTAVHRVADHFGRLDVLVNCAGMHRAAVIDDLSADDLHAHYDVNVVAPLLAAAEAGRLMARQPDGGAIVLVAAGCSGRVPPGATAALASQAAVPVLARALAGEYATIGGPVRVNCVLWNGSAESGPEPTPAIDATAQAIVAIVENRGLSGSCLTL
jgi:NAD(P)-dependent dehydrogenase (short-subunit alcohol dehydrogenase family)